MIRDDRLYLSHISDCIERITEYTSGGRDDFMANRKTQDAVMRNFEIIGEAVKQLSEDTLQKTPDIPWRRMRDFVISLSTATWASISKKSGTSS